MTMLPKIMLRGSMQIANRIHSPSILLSAARILPNRNLHSDSMSSNVSSSSEHHLTRTATKDPLNLSNNFSTCRNYSTNNLHKLMYKSSSVSTPYAMPKSVRTFRHVSHDNDPSTIKLAKQLQHEEEVIDTHAGWLIRLANENGYLSWCRNTYIATIAGATIYGQYAVVPYGKEAGILLVMMGGLNLLLGSSTYCYNLVALRETMLMYRSTSLVHLGAAILHVVLWFSCMAIYLGYVEEDDEDEGSEDGGKDYKSV